MSRIHLSSGPSIALSKRSSRHSGARDDIKRGCDAFCQRMTRTRAARKQMLGLNCSRIEGLLKLLDAVARLLGVSCSEQTVVRSTAS